MLDDIDINAFIQVHDADSIGSVSATDIAVSCPLCREGKSWKRKHRLHLYTKPGYETPAVHCWNCSYTSNLYGYLKEFHPSEYVMYTKAKRGKGFAELKMQYKEDKPTETVEPEDISQIDIGFDMSTSPVEDEEETAVRQTDINAIDIGFDMSTPVDNKQLNYNAPIIEKTIFKNKPILVPAVPNLMQLPEDAKAYIEGRGLDVQDSWLYSPKNNKIRFNDTNVLLSEFIVVPLTMGNKWYGFQALAWKQKRFFVYLVTGNSSWKVENWESINKDEEVFIMESIYDRLSTGLINSIAILGSNLHNDRLKELKQPIFCLDNQNIDEKAKEETIKYLEAGYKCFIWPKETPSHIKDFNDLRKLGVSYEKIENMIKKNINQGITGLIKLKML